MPIKAIHADHTHSGAATVSNGHMPAAPNGHDLSAVTLPVPARAGRKCVNGHAARRKGSGKPKRQGNIETLWDKWEPPRPTKVKVAAALWPVLAEKLTTRAPGMH